MTDVLRPLETLATARRLGVLGDTHGDMEHVLAVSARMHERGVRVLLILGDFGFIWPRGNWGVDLSKLSRRLAARQQSLFFVDGNHEDFARLYRHPVSADGLRWLRPNIAHIPRGYRTVLSSGKTLAALGGAASVDVGNRVEGQSWWEEETITDHDLEVLGHEHACVLVGHDAPIGVPTLEAHLTATNHWWPTSGLAHSAMGRRMFHRGFMQVRPKLYLGGHYHLHVDETVEFNDDAGDFTSRIVILNMNGHATVSQAVLDVDTLQLKFFSLRDEHRTPVGED
ncbi:MAG: metallophosphoesterase [Salinibacterium sp.]|nr:hypothetical protein [Salinibacterium sp.]MBF0671358.1 metallophosphoesterase [Salinibacterium sp.]